jgi:hypothetical protein
MKISQGILTSSRRGGVEGLKKPFQINGKAF